MKVNTKTESVILIIANATPSTVIGIMIHIPNMDSASILDMASTDDTAMVSGFTSVTDTTADMDAIIIGNSNAQPCPENPEDADFQI